MNAKRTREPLQLLRQLRAVCTARAGEGRAVAKGEVAEIEKALARLTYGTYGSCVACGDPIAPDRLKLLPATPYCLRCAIERVHDPGDPAEPTVTSGSLCGDHVRSDTELAPC